VLGELHCDLFLGAHGAYFGLADKFPRLKPGAPNPFIDPTEMRRFVDRSEREFRAALATEQAARPGS